MGSFRYSAQCCNNCRYWNCQYDREVRGDKVFTYSNEACCLRDGSSRVSDDSCSSFGHFDGATATTPLGSDEKFGSGDSTLRMISGMDEPSRAYTASLVEDFMRRHQEPERAARTPQRVRHTCPSCSGTGHRPCTSCGGSGKERCGRCAGKGGFLTELEIREDYTSFSKKQHWLPDVDLDLDFYGFGDDWCKSIANNEYRHVLCDRRVKVPCDEGPFAHAADAMVMGPSDMDFPDEMSGEIRQDVLDEYKLACRKIDEEADAWADGGDSRPRVSEVSCYCVQYSCIVKLEFNDPIGFPRVALVNLANGQVHLYDVDRTAAKARLSELERLAEAGDAEMQNLVGKLYAHYDGVPDVVDEDGSVAVQWFLKAARRGCADAMDNLGNCYKNGDGVEEDASLAAAWYMKAAKRNLPWGQYHLARCFLNGTGMAEDNDLALFWYLKAARQGLADAQTMVGRCAEEGWGMKEDPELAFYWMEKAARNGDDVAMHNLSVFYGKGYGCEKDERSKRYWAEEAEKNGYTESPDS